jgi:nucleoside permease NupC
MKNKIGNGAKTGMKIVLIIAASLIAVLSLLAFVDALLTWLGHFYNIESLTVQVCLLFLF